MYKSDIGLRVMQYIAGMSIYLTLVYNYSKLQIHKQSLVIQKVRAMYISHARYVNLLTINLLKSGIFLKIMCCCVVSLVSCTRKLCVIGLHMHISHASYVNKSF